MSALAGFYPGDRFTSFVIVVSVTVSVLCAAALLISRRLEHDPAARDKVFLTALICAAVSPLVAWTLDRTGASLISIRFSFSADLGVADSPATGLRPENAVDVTQSTKTVDPSDIQESRAFPKEPSPVGPLAAPDVDGIKQERVPTIDRIRLRDRSR